MSVGGAHATAFDADRSRGASARLTRWAAVVGVGLATAQALSAVAIFASGTAGGIAHATAATALRGGAAADLAAGAAFGGGITSFASSNIAPESAAAVGGVGAPALTGGAHGSGPSADLARCSAVQGVIVRADLTSAIVAPGAIVALLVGRAEALSVVTNGGSSSGAIDAVEAAVGIVLAGLAGAVFAPTPGSTAGIVAGALSAGARGCCAAARQAIVTAFRIQVAGLALAGDAFIACAAWRRGVTRDAGVAAGSANTAKAEAIDAAGGAVGIDGARDAGFAFAIGPGRTGAAARASVSVCGVTGVSGPDIAGVAVGLRVWARSVRGRI